MAASSSSPALCISYNRAWYQATEGGKSHLIIEPSMPCELIALASSGKPISLTLEDRSVVKVPSDRLQTVEFFLSFADGSRKETEVEISGIGLFSSWERAVFDEKRSEMGEGEWFVWSLQEDGTIGTAAFPLPPQLEEMRPLFESTVFWEGAILHWDAEALPSTWREGPMIVWGNLLDVGTYVSFRVQVAAPHPEEGVAGYVRPVSFVRREEGWQQAPLLWQSRELPSAVDDMKIYFQSLLSEDQEVDPNLVPPGLTERGIAAFLSLPRWDLEGAISKEELPFDSISKFLPRIALHAGVRGMTSTGRPYFAVGAGDDKKTVWTFWKDEEEQWQFHSSLRGHHPPSYLEKAAAFWSNLPDLPCVMEEADNKKCAIQ